MNDYREFRIDISPCTTDGTDIMAYLLAEIGFESFVPDEKGLTAYIRNEDYNPVEINNALAQYPFAAALEVSSKFIEGKDWNAEWEKNYFKPIVIGSECVIHSTFHTDVPPAKYDIVIDPKMAFGTGHHATTSQVIEALLNLEMAGKNVTDMGTGTAILSILCAMRGANHVTGVEIDSFAYINAIENVSANGMTSKITLINGDASCLTECPKADIFVANINRNVILADLDKYVSNLAPGATVVFSGFYQHDIPAILECAQKMGLAEVYSSEKNEWACLILKYM